MFRPDGSGSVCSAARAIRHPVEIEGSEGGPGQQERLEIRLALEAAVVLDG